MNRNNINEDETFYELKSLLHEDEIDALRL